MSEILSFFSRFKQNDFNHEVITEEGPFVGKLFGRDSSEISSASKPLI